MKKSNFQNLIFDIFSKSLILLINFDCFFREYSLTLFSEKPIGQINFKLNVTRCHFIQPVRRPSFSPFIELIVNCQVFY